MRQHDDADVGTFHDLEDVSEACMSDRCHHCIPGVLRIYPRIFAYARLGVRNHGQCCDQHRASYFFHHAASSSICSIRMPMIWRVFPKLVCRIDVTIASPVCSAYVHGFSLMHAWAFGTMASAATSTALRTLFIMLPLPPSVPSACPVPFLPCRSGSHVLNRGNTMVRRDQQASRP